MRLTTKIGCKSEISIHNLHIVYRGWASDGSTVCCLDKYRMGDRFLPNRGAWVKA